MSMRALACVMVGMLMVSGVLLWRRPGPPSRAARKAPARPLAAPDGVERAEPPPLPEPAGPRRHLLRVAAAPLDTRPLDEAPLMARLRSLEGTNPELVIDLARQGNARFAESPDAPERSSILIHALASQGRSSEARGAAEDMVNRYPESAWVHEIERFTGAHRHRTARVDESGALEFY